MDHTTNLQLNKPGYNDPVDVQDLNENFDTLDQNIKNIYDRVGGGSAQDTRQAVTTPTAAAVGSANKPVYVNASGTVVPCSDVLVEASGSSVIVVNQSQGEGLPLYGQLTLVNPGGYTKVLVSLWSMSEDQMLPFTTVFGGLDNTDPSFVTTAYLGWPGQNTYKGKLSRAHNSHHDLILRLEATCSALAMQCVVKAVWLP